jgi:hypothetical protein
MKRNTTLGAHASSTSWQDSSSPLIKSPQSPTGCLIGLLSLEVNSDRAEDRNKNRGGRGMPNLRIDEDEFLVSLRSPEREGGRPAIRYRSFAFPTTLNPRAEGTPGHGASPPARQIRQDATRRASR